MAAPLRQQMPPSDPPPQAGRWSKIDTAPAQSVDAIQAEFQAIFESAGSPRGAALFCNHVLLESTALLFTPEAASIAQQLIDAHGGVRCDEPAVGIFLVGNDSDRSLLTVPELTKPAVDP